MEKCRKVVLTDPYEFGYGPRIMQETKVCLHCGNSEDALKRICSRCGQTLPDQTLYQIYLSRHKKCSACDTVLAPYMRYCPHCGMCVDGH